MDFDDIIFQIEGMELVTRGLRARKVSYLR